MNLLVSEHLLDWVNENTENLWEAIKEFELQIEGDQISEDQISLISEEIKTLETKFDQLLLEINDKQVKHNLRNKIVGLTSTIENILDFAYNKPEVSLGLIRRFC